MSSHTIKYCNNPFKPTRRKTRVVSAGNIKMGGNYPIRIQSMTITNTMDTRATVEQTVQLANAGCEIVRITAPSVAEAENLKNIRDELRKRGCTVPLVADIHFTPNAALKAAEFVEKVRINPGNYADKKKFEILEYTDLQYQEELERIHDKFKPLVLCCKESGVAMRIGTNHGSLSDRIMNRYGDSPEGMVESALEFVNICRLYNYHELVLSMKSSNPQVMIQAYRLLAARMFELEMDYPFHLGVTEAGDGEDGRIKSAVGIGSLLEDGIGDTIRVSLTEDPVFEIPVAKQIAQKYDKLWGTNDKGEYKKIDLPSPPPKTTIWDYDTSGLTEKRNPYTYQRRKTSAITVGKYPAGGEHLVRVELSAAHFLSDPAQLIGEIKELSDIRELPVLSEDQYTSDPIAEMIHLNFQAEADYQAFSNLQESLRKQNLHPTFAARIDRFSPSLRHVLKDLGKVVYAITHEKFDSDWKTDAKKLIQTCKAFEKPVQWELSHQARHWVHYAMELIYLCYENDFHHFFFSIESENPVSDYRLLAAKLEELNCPAPLVLNFRSNNAKAEFLIHSSIQLGSLLCDGIGDSIHIQAPGETSETIQLAYNILQATRLRISKTEFISCPSCGRTLFDLQTTTERIKSKTGHLKGVKIAIMGCIVNGPGEMADADFGYVGSGPGKINLYVGKEVVGKNVPEDQADETLIDLIKSHGKWIEKSI